MRQNYTKGDWIGLCLRFQQKQDHVSENINRKVKFDENLRER